MSFLCTEILYITLDHRSQAGPTSDVVWKCDFVITLPQILTTLYIILTSVLES